MNSRRKLFDSQVHRKWTEREIQFLSDNWQTMPDEAIGKELNRTSGAVYQQRCSLGLFKLEREDMQAYLPTADEIATACAQIQSGWTDVERQKRLAYGKAKAVQMPCASMKCGKLGRAEIVGITQDEMTK